MVLAQDFSRGCSQDEVKILTRAAECDFKMVHSSGLQIDAGFWQKALLLCHKGLSIGLLECLHDMATGFLYGS